MSPLTIDSRRFGSSSSVRKLAPSLLRVAAVSVTLEAFIVPIASPTRSQGWRVDAIAGRDPILGLSVDVPMERYDHRNILKLHESLYREFLSTPTEVSS